MFILHITIWLIRIFGSLLDGLVGHGSLTWLQFHIPNWIRRDIPIVILYWIIYGAPWLDLAVWLLWTAVHFAMHWAFYWLGKLLKSGFKMIILKVE